jgi:hypothetical protein
MPSQNAIDAFRNQVDRIKGQVAIIDECIDDGHYGRLPSEFYILRQLSYALVGIGNSHMPPPPSHPAPGQAARRVAR